MAARRRQYAGDCHRDVKTDGVETEQKLTHANGVHNIGGQQVRTDSNTDGLQEGIYIVNGKKTLLKK